MNDSPPMSPYGSSMPSNNLQPPPQTGFNLNLNHNNNNNNNNNNNQHKSIATNVNNGANVANNQSNNGMNGSINLGASSLPLSASQVLEQQKRQNEALLAKLQATQRDID